ncbi:MAG: hypothetical protein LBD09_05425 [Treponema sp.]|jgi:hypothetical protein|nr:hypothetical protein [Treponema sp.]
MPVKTPKKATPRKTVPKATKTAPADVWAAFERTQIAQQRTERIIESLAEEHKKTELAQQKTELAQQKTDKSMKELHRLIGDLGNRFGEFNERTLVPDLVAKFKKYGFTFGKMSERVQMDDDEHDIHMEIDALLENGTQAMVVEVKTNLKPEDIEDHKRRMEKIRAYADFHNDRRSFFGALAATVARKDTKLHALRQGFYVIEPTGESVKITPPDTAAAKPKAW